MHFSELLVNKAYHYYKELLQTAQGHDSITKETVFLLFQGPFKM